MKAPRGHGSSSIERLHIEVRAETTSNPSCALFCSPFHRGLKELGRGTRTGGGEGRRRGSRDFRGVPLKKPTHPFGCSSSRGRRAGASGGAGGGGSGAVSPTPSPPPWGPRWHRAQPRPPHVPLRTGSRREALPRPTVGSGWAGGAGALPPTHPRPEPPASPPPWPRVGLGSPPRRAGATCLRHDPLTGRKGSGSHFNLAI